MWCWRVGDFDTLTPPVATLSVRSCTFSGTLTGGRKMCTSQVRNQSNLYLYGMLSIKSDLVKYLYSCLERCWRRIGNIDTCCVTLCTRSRTLSSQVRNQSNLCCNKLQCITSYSAKLIATRLQNSILKNNLYAANIYNTLFFHRNTRHMEIFNIINLRTIK